MAEDASPTEAQQLAQRENSRRLDTGAVSLTDKLPGHEGADGPRELSLSCVAVGAPPDTESVFVGNISSATTDEELREHFRAYPFLELKRPFDPKSGRPVPYAYLVFSSLAEARRCVQTMQNKELHGQILHVAFASRLPSIYEPLMHERGLVQSMAVLQAGLKPQGLRRPRVVEARADSVWVGPPADIGNKE